MEKLQELNLQLQLIAEEIDNYNETELNKAQYNCDKILNSLKGIKKYYSKQKKYDLTYCKELISNGKKIRNQINERILKLKKSQEDNIKNNENQFKIIELDEVLAILKSNSSKKVKITALKNIINSVTITIQIFELNNQELKKSSKESLDNKNYAEYAEINRMIKTNWQEIKYYKNILNKCKTLLAQIKNHDLKINYPKNKKVKPKVERENKYYYLIINDLLNNDQNYLFLKEILEENKNFLNARFNGEHIIFEILDRYIYNLKLKLVNQKLVHVNHNYYYSLLKLFLNEDLELNEEEQQYLKERLNELKNYLDEKKYANALEIQEQIDELFIKNDRRNVEPLTLYQNYLNQLMVNYSFNPYKSNLSKDYFINIQQKVDDFKENYYKTYGTYPDDKIIAENTSLPLYAIHNQVIGNTLTFENSRYAYSISYDEEYNIYFRIHVLDTTFIEEDSIWYPELKNGNLTKNKILKFKANKENYPTITYQIKISKEGIVYPVKIFESSIKVDRLILNKDLINYREDEELKNFIGCFKILSNYYDYNFENINSINIQNLIDEILNKQLKDFFADHNLPSLYYVNIELDEEDKTKIHNQICYYLSKIPKKEAHQLVTILNQISVSRFYTEEAVLESYIELDSKTFIGYNNLVLLRAYLRNLPLDIIVMKYADRIQECKENLNKDDLFIDYFNERKLIRRRMSSSKEEKNETTTNC